MPFFDQPLIEIALQTGYAIPPFLDLCFDFILQNLDQEGIFRVPGNTAEVKRLVSLFDAGGVTEIKVTPANRRVTVNNICNIITRFVKRIPDHLLLDKNVKQWDCDLTPDQVVKLVNDLPLCNKAFLSRLFGFFTKVAEHSDKNLMGVSNLSKIISASLIEDTNNPFWLLKTETAQIFFTHYQDIFGPMSSLDENGNFLTREQFQEKVGDIFASFFCQSSSFHKPEIASAPQERQKKMCRRIAIEKLTWDQMFDLLLHHDTQSNNSVSDAFVTPLA